MSLIRSTLVLGYEEFRQVSLDLAAASNEPVYGLHSTSTAWGIERVGGLPTQWFGTGEPSAVYESRVFGVGIDLRWTRRGDSGSVIGWFDSELTTGHSRVVGESKSWDDVRRIPRRYVLWGRVDESTDEGVVLSDARVGRYTIPAPGRGRNMWLQAVEYLVPSIDGNTVVVTECLEGFTSEG